MPENMVLKDEVIWLSLLIHIIMKWGKDEQHQHYKDTRQKLPNHTKQYNDIAVIQFVSICFKLWLDLDTMIYI